MAFKPLLPPCLREFCQRRLSEEPASRPTPTFQNRSRVVQSKGRQRPHRSLGARPCYVPRLCPPACLSVSTCACRVDAHVDTAHGPTEAHVHKEIQVCLRVHTCLPLLMDTEAHEARAFATICACRAGVRHVSLNLGTYVFVSV